MINRMIRAARLDVNVYEELERDTTANGQALTVVIIVALAGAIGGFIAALFGAATGAGGAEGITGAIIAAIATVIAAVIGWAVWAFVTYFIGTRLFGGTATWGELLRTIGFAYTPLILQVFIFIPCLGGLLALIGGIWALIAGVVAVRQALDFTTGKAIITVIIGWIALLIIYVILAVILAAIGVGIGAVTGALPS